MIKQWIPIAILLAFNVPPACAQKKENGNGNGIYAGQVVHVHNDGSQTVESSARFDSTAKSYVPNPIDMGPADDQVFQVLYGTGIRHAGPAGIFLPAIDVTVGTVDVPAVFAPQGQYPGLDQVNLMLPRSLAGAGTVNIALDVVVSPNSTSSRLISANTVTGGRVKRRPGYHVSV